MPIRVDTCTVLHLPSTWRLMMARPFSFHSFRRGRAFFTSTHHRAVQSPRPHQRSYQRASGRAPTYLISSLDNALYHYIFSCLVSGEWYRYFLIFCWLEFITYCDSCGASTSTSLTFFSLSSIPISYLSIDGSRRSNCSLWRKSGPLPRSQGRS